MEDHFCADCLQTCDCTAYALTGKCEGCGDVNDDVDWNDATDEGTEE